MRIGYNVLGKDIFTVMLFNTRYGKRILEEKWADFCGGADGRCDGRGVSADYRQIQQSL